MGQLKALAKELGIGLDGCLEKADLIPLTIELAHEPTWMGAGSHWKPFYLHQPGVHGPVLSPFLLPSQFCLLGAAFSLLLVTTRGYPFSTSPVAPFHPATAQTDIVNRIESSPAFKC